MAETKTEFKIRAQQEHQQDRGQFNHQFHIQDKQQEEKELPVDAPRSYLHKKRSRCLFHGAVWLVQVKEKNVLILFLLIAVTRVRVALWNGKAFAGPAGRFYVTGG